MGHEPHVHSHEHPTPEEYPLPEVRLSRVSDRMTYKLEPLGARILVRLKPLKSKSQVIVLPDERQTAREADVLAIGPEVRDVSVGQTVIVNSLAGQQVADEIIMPESAVLGYAEVVE